MRKLSFGIATVAISSVAFAADFTVKNGTTDWDSPGSYEQGELPGDGDVVYVPANATVTLSSTDAASVARFKRFSRVVPMSEASTIILDFATDDELPVSITAWETGSTVPRLFRYGPIVKKGAGTLHLSACNDALTFPANDETYATTAVAAGDYYCGIRVEAGALKIQQDCTRSNMKLGMVTVEEGATLFFPNSTTAGRAVFTSIGGSGLITNSSSKTSLVLFGKKDTAAATFSGRIDGKFGFTFRGDAQALDGDFDFFIENGSYPGAVADTLNVGFANGESTEIGVKSFGHNGAASSFGFMGQNRYRTYSGTPALNTSYSGLTLHYLGEGETVNRSLTMTRAYGVSGPYCIIDAGAAGGLTFLGNWTSFYKSNGGQRLVLAGDHANVCIASNTINDCTISTGTPGYPLYLTKEGTGTWRLAAIDRPNFASGISVDEGVLQYESIAPQGVACSLGVATNLTDGTTGTTAKNADHRVPYAIRLGGKTAGDKTFKDSGRFEYVGSKSFAISDREIAVAGKGGLRANGTATQRFSNIYGISADAMTLYLDGSSTADNEVNNVSDGAGGGKLSVTKEGSGKWILSGEQSWGGDLAVKGGELVVRNPTNYSWYSWTITSVGDPSGGQLHLAEFCLCDAQNNYLTQDKYDAEGKFVSHAISVVTEPNAMLECGQAIITTPALANPHNATALFDNIGYNGRWLYSGTVPQQDDPDTWLTVKLRLPSGVPGASGYDIANGAGRTGGGKCANCASNYFIKASLDGFSWDLIKTVEMKFDKFNWTYGAYVYGVTDDKKDVHTKCDPINPGPSVLPNVLGNVQNVEVSGGGKLTLEPGSAPITIKGLKLDALTGGTISGFDFAETGVVSVENVTGDTSELPLAVSGGTTFENVSGWSVTVNGAEKPAWSVKAKDGKLTLVRPGVLLIVR